jgi:hypothetical protein
VWLVERGLERAAVGDHLLEGLVLGLTFFDELADAHVGAHDLEGRDASAADLG